MNRGVGRSVAVLFCIVIALTLAGCGGSADKTSGKKAAASWPMVRLEFTVHPVPSSTNFELLIQDENGENELARVGASAVSEQNTTCTASFEFRKYPSAEVGESVLAGKSHLIQGMEAGPKRLVTKADFTHGRYAVGFDTPTYYQPESQWADVRLVVEWPDGSRDEFVNTQGIPFAPDMADTGWEGVFVIDVDNATVSGPSGDGEDYFVQQ
jgi:hypothetical protein